MKTIAHLIERLDHVSIAVEDIRGILPLIELMGGSFHDGGYEGPLGFRWAQFDLPGGRIEVIEPVTEDCFLRRDLARRGPGMHHVTFKVIDLRAAIDGATDAGLRIVGHSEDDPEWKEAFIHPKSANGVLVQLAEFDDPPQTAPTLDEVLLLGPPG